MRRTKHNVAARRDPPTFYSGLVVTCKPGQFESVGEALKSLPVEVHQSDAASGRYVVVLEEPSVEAETERFRAIQMLPFVADVSLIVHRNEPDDDTN